MHLEVLTLRRQLLIRGALALGVDLGKGGMYIAPLSPIL